MTTSAEAQLDAFLAKYTPEIERLGREALSWMRRRLPGATALVYDNYQALVIGFGPSERSSAALFSIALYPRWVTLVFLKGAGLPDPQGLLKGTGSQVRHIVLTTAATLARPEVGALIAAALATAPVPIPPAGPGALVIKSISARQRPRRPVAKMHGQAPPTSPRAR